MKIGSTDDSLLYRIRVDKSVKKQNTKTRENQNKNRLPPIKWHRGVCVWGGGGMHSRFYVRAGEIAQKASQK